MQLQFVCLLCRDAKSFEIGETVHIISPQSVLIISQKGSVTLILGVLRNFFYANYMHFLCAHFSEAEIKFLLILFLHVCFCMAVRPNPLACCKLDYSKNPNNVNLDNDEVFFFER